MGVIKLELRCPKVVNGICIDPSPDFSFDALISEVNSLELKLSARSSARVPSEKICSREHSQTRTVENGRRGFMMKISDDLEGLNGDSEAMLPIRRVSGQHSTSDVGSPREHSQTRTVENGRKGFLMKISDDDLEDLNGDSEAMIPVRCVPARHSTSDVASPSGCNASTDNVHAEPKLCLMDKADTISGALVELSHERQLEVKEEIRSVLSTFGENIAHIDEMLGSSLDNLQKSIECRRQMYREIDLKYRQKITELIDSRLLAIEEEHEEWSQIEEMKIKNDEAKIVERARLDEKAQRENAEAEEEERISAENKIIEEEERAAAEAVMKGEEQSAQNEAPKDSKTTSAEISNEISKNGVVTDTASSSGGISMHASASALKLEEIRIQWRNEVSELKKTLKIAYTKDFQSFERQIARQIKQISGSEEAVREKATELVKILKNSVYQPPIGYSVFAEKVVSLCVNPGTSAFAVGRVVVLVTSAFPHAMDLLLAELYTSSIYIVPKHVDYSESIEKDAYKRILLFQERDGKMESTKQYLQRLESCMKLYGAVIQTKIDGVENMHGLKEGWAWLARLLNSLPANIFTAVALEAFLRMAGFALFRNYRSQFKKMLNVISKHFLHHLGPVPQEDSGLGPVLQRLVSYIETSRFLEEPEGSNLPGSTFSSTCVPKPD